MGIQAIQFDELNTTTGCIEFNEAWTVLDEEAYRREICERLDIYDIQFDEDGIPF